MTELEKLDSGLDYCFFDDEVVQRKERALKGCQKYNAIDPADYKSQYAALKELLGSVGKAAYIQPSFNCDNGKNISVGEDFIANYNVTILDIAPVHIDDYRMVGQNTLISTVGHPLSPKGRRAKTANSKPVTIGNDVWIGGNCTILPGVTIGNNVIIAAGAVVKKDIPDNCIAAGVPAKVIKQLENDIED
ncbi:sugar O-acetyltransferase [Treponema parvum]|uniref:Acetyltransferase n=1 Tax=Treponema parvum TaxID=138851 RepID=A0A975EXJ3_9SPIR|nr:sugar O-acetyltransferase [Treponema parvum]QTQ10811.1 sugar O-acetyltransferase [Treponema parvum]QTQ17233.1 sugar O-acetyltransferase [Treponema parvum]